MLMMPTATQAPCTSSCKKVCGLICGSGFIQCFPVFKIIDIIFEESYLPGYNPE
jgi:hypothetical protein